MAKKRKPPTSSLNLASAPSTSTSTSTSTSLVAPTFGPPILRRALIAFSALYLTCVWLDATSGKIDPYLPQPFRFFVQVAQLFPRAAQNPIEWRVQGYRCAIGKFEELDIAPYFPIHASDKESRFDRAMHFFMNDAKILRRLARYITDQESRLGPDHKIGGVMLFSLRWPLPSIEDHATEPPYQRLALYDVPREIERHYFYVTSEAEREKNCGPP
jgi:hypothetical protein